MAYIDYKNARLLLRYNKTRVMEGELREGERERIERKQNGGRQRRRGRGSVRGRKETSCTCSQIGKAATVLWILSPVQQVTTLKMSGRVISITLFPLELSIVIC